ncbi:MAG: metallophosphoesterase [Gordonia sp. (in: high G+C Gram-positive bacteria)]
MFVVAQLSDLHFNGTREHRARVMAALDYLVGTCGGSRNIDALLVTGDLADDGLPEEYREAATTLVTDIPTLTILGNHDDRGAYSQVHTGRRSTSPVNRALQLDDGSSSLLLLALDSSIPGRNDGYLGDETLRWAREQIAHARDTDVLLAFHHPPTTIGMPFMDERRMFDTEGLESLMADFPNVLGVACGHAHSSAATVFCGRPLIVAPGVSSTLSLPFEGEDFLNEVQGPGVALHLIDDHRMTTHFRTLPAW